MAGAADSFSPIDKCWSNSVNSDRYLRLYGWLCFTPGDSLAAHLMISNCPVMVAEDWCFAIHQYGEKTIHVLM
jgi:hypothetical protein